MATEDQVKFLLKVSQSKKGNVDMDFAAGALALIGFSIEPLVVSFDLGKHTDGSYIFQNMLSDWAKKHEVRHVSDPRYGDPKVWDIAFKNDNVAQAAADLERHVTIVDAQPKRPEVGVLYATPISRGAQRDRLYIKDVWLGDTAWKITAPNGKAIAIPTPVSRRTGLPQSGPQNIAPFWTFIYKNGAAEAAKAYLASAVPAEDIADATRTKAQREQVARRRSSLPEVQKVFVDITEARYDEMVKWLNDWYMRSIDVALEMQEKTGRIKWDMISEAKPLMTTEYVTGKGLRYIARPDAAEIAMRNAKESADAARESFVDKNTFRISEIAKLKGATPTPKLLRIEPGATFNSEIRFTFPDSSRFDLRNKTVWKRSPLGVHFAQFPTTFHNVVMPDGSKMAAPLSEERMQTVFAGSKKTSNPARRLARLFR